jgi:hypothetical protein
MTDLMRQEADQKTPIGSMAKNISAPRVAKHYVISAG